MKPNQRTTSVSDKRLSRALRLGVLLLVVGVLAFAGIYYQDQHIDAGPSLIGRQTASAEQAVEKAPGNIGARLLLAQAYQLGKQQDKALTQYDEVLKVLPTNRPALLGRGQVLVATGDLKEAVKTYQKITGKAIKGEFAGADPQLEEANLALGRIALTQARPKDAVIALEKAVRIDPGDADAWYSLGTANLKNGAPKAAVIALNNALKYVPTGWCDPYSTLNKAYTQLGDKPRAEYAGAMVDFCQKRPADANRRLQALTKGPAAVDAMLGLGMVAERASDRPGAIRWYQKVLSTDAKNLNALSGLSRLGAGKTS